MLQHSPLSYYIPHALRPHNYILQSAKLSRVYDRGMVLTVVLSNILQRKRQFRVLVFHNTDFAERTLPNHSTEGEVIEADYYEEKTKSVSSAIDKHNTHKGQNCNPTAGD